MTTPTHDRFLRLGEVLDRTRLTRSTLYRKMSAGTFPRQVRVSERCVRWRESEVTEWQRNPMFYRADEADGA